MLTRRDLLLLLMGLLSLEATPAFAKKGGGDDDDDDGGGGGGGGNDDDDDDDGGGNSGNGGGGGNDDDDDDDGGGNSGSGGGGGNDDDDDDNGGGGDDDKRGRRDAKNARDAVKKGKAASLKEMLRLVRGRYPGRVIKVDVSGSKNDIIYTIKLIDEKNRRMQIRVNATKRRILGAKYI